MLYLGFEPTVAGWWAQTDPMCYDGRPFMMLLLLLLFMMLLLLLLLLMLLLLFVFFATSGC